MIRPIFLLFLTATPAMAEYVAAKAVIRPKQIISPSDLKVLEGDMPAAYQDITALIGMESTVMVAPGRPILKGTISEPAIIERNDIVEIVYETSSLVITVEGRSLSRGAVGERIRVMNLGSRATVFGTVSEDGRIIIR